MTDIGLDSIWERTAQLTHRLKQALGPITGVTLYSPPEADRSAALVAFAIANWDDEELTLTLRQRWPQSLAAASAAHLQKPKPIIVRPLTIAHNGVRASVPFFLLEEEIDLLAAAVRHLAESRR